MSVTVSLTEVGFLLWATTHISLNLVIPGPKQVPLLNGEPHEKK